MSFVPAVVLGVAAFVLMEPFTAATHRWVMHGVGERLHRSHHRRPGSHAWEANDWYPVVFAAIVMTAMWAGFNRDGLAALVPVTVGVTAYGAAYALVHDVYIHGRLRWRGSRFAVLDRLAAAHGLHHRFGGAPYGMLLPVVPATVRRRADAPAPDPSRNLRGSLR